MTEETIKLMVKLLLTLAGGCVIYFGCLGLIELIHDFTHPDDRDERND